MTQAGVAAHAVQGDLIGRGRRTFRERASLAMRAVEARAAGPEGNLLRRSRQARGWSRPAPGHGPWSLRSRPLVAVVTEPVTAQPTTITAQVTANTVAGSGQRGRSSRRRLPQEQRLAPRWAGGTKTAESGTYSVQAILLVAGSQIVSRFSASKFGGTSSRPRAGVSELGPEPGPARWYADEPLRAGHALARAAGHAARIQSHGYFQRATAMT